jgi:hypothetical protein
MAKYYSAYSGADIDAAVAGVQAMSNYSATLLAAEDAEAARTVLELPGDGANPLITQDDLWSALESYAATDVFTPTISEGVLTVDLQHRNDTYHVITLTENIDAVSVINYSDSAEKIAAYLRVLNPDGYDLPLTAWALVGVSGRAFTSEYHVYTDATPTNIEMLSLDGWDTVDLQLNAPRQIQTIEISQNTTLSWATHAGKKLKCTAAVTLTVDEDTDLENDDEVLIDPVGGNVVIAESSATVNSVGDKLTISQHGAAVLIGRGSDTCTLVGTLE